MLSNPTKIYVDSASLLYISQEWAENVHVYENIIEIFRKHAEIYTDLSKSQLDDIFYPADLNDVSEIYNFYTGNGLPNFETAEQDFAALTDEKKYENYSNSIFIVNKDSSYSKNIRDKYGVWVVSLKELSNRSFEYEYPQTFSNPNFPIKNNDGWDTVFASEKEILPPSNSAVVSDSNLLVNDFKDSKGFKRYQGLENLKYLLKACLPQSLEIPFYLYIICPAKPGENKKKTDRIINDWIGEVKSLREYKIVVEFLTTVKTLHSRNLYSNYYYIDLDRGFYVFDKGFGKVHIDGPSFNKMTILSYLTNPFSRGNTKLYVCRDELDKLEKKYKDMISGIGDPVIHDPYDKNELQKNRILFKLGS